MYGFTATQRHQMKNENFTICNSQSNSHFRLRYLMQAFSWGIIFSNDQFHGNCFKGNIRSSTPCFDALIVLFV